MFGPLKSEECQIFAQKLKLLNPDKTLSTISGSDDVSSHLWRNTQQQNQEVSQSVSVFCLYFFSVTRDSFFSPVFYFCILFVFLHWSCRIVNTCLWQDRSFENVNLKLAAFAERAAEQFILDRKTVYRFYRVSSSLRLPRGYTAQLTASVCLWACWQTGHTSFTL